MFDVVRTTLSLDDDVLASAKALADQRGVSIGAILSELARKGLAPASAGKVRNGIQLFPIRSNAGTVTPELIKTLAEEVD